MQKEITLPPDTKINFTALVAKRRVNKLLLDEVGLFFAEEPKLVAGDRLVWRVPVIFSLPATGPLGQAGTLDVDVQTGQILHTREILEAIRERGKELAPSTSCN